MARILHLIPYMHLVPPQNGGQLRCFHLVCELARENEVHAIVLQPEAELFSRNNECRLPDTVRAYSPATRPPPRTVFSLLPRRVRNALQYRWIRRSWRGPASSALLEMRHLIANVLACEKIDLVLFEHLSSMMAAPLVRRLAPSAVRVLDADNIDHKLQTGGVPGIEQSRGYRQTRWYETHLRRHVHAFLAPSNEDRREFEALNRHEIEGFVVPNGVDTMARPFDTSRGKSERREILFCGSLEHAPNHEGLNWFHSEIWPLIVARRPETKLIVVGRGGDREDYGALLADQTVEFIGFVEDVVPHYQRSSISVAPLLRGSGTRLKILEAMSLGNPVVSTTIGVEGIAAINGEHLLVADQPQDFANAVVCLLHDAQLFHRIRRSARELVQTTYDWRIIGKHLNETVVSLVNHRLKDNLK